MRLLSSVLGLSIAIASACSSDVASPPAGPTVRFDGSSATPDFMAVPFPSDAYLVGGNVANINLSATVKENPTFLAHELAKQNGFSRITLSLFYVDDPSKGLDDNNEPTTAEIDPTTLPVKETDCTTDQSSVYLVDLETQARIPCRASFHHPQSGKTRPALGVGPARGIVLEEGHKYAAVVTSRVKDTAGKSLVASGDFAKILAGGGTSPLASVYGPALTTIHAVLDGALGSDKATIVGIAPYTTNKMSSQLFKTRDWLEGQPTPALKWDAASVAPMGAVKFAKPDAAGMVPGGFTSTDEWLGMASAKLPDGSDDPDNTLPARAHDKIAAVGTAVFDAVNFLQVKTGYDTLDHATVIVDADGKFVPPPEKPTSKIWVSFAIPTAAVPANGYPVVIVQHGLSSSRTYLLDLANTFCNAGWAVAAIDSVTFGARAAEPQYETDLGSNFGGTYKGPDGFADPVSGATNGSGDFFGSLLNIGALRDQLRQAALDTTQLVRVLRSSPDVSVLETGAKLDGSRIAYIGDSLGGIEGAVAAAIEPNVSAWVLNVAGGGVVMDLAAHSPVISISLSQAGGFNFGFQADVFTPSHPMITLVQSIVDLGDPLTYASALVKSPAPLMGMPTKPRNLIQVEVLNDEVVSNEGGEALARAAGLPMAVPNMGSNVELLDLATLRNPELDVRRIPFVQAQPDSSGVIHDAPAQGVTAVVVQAGPGAHGSDLVSSTGKHSYAAPFAQYDTGSPFNLLGAPYNVRCPYRELQAMAVAFFSDAFAGKVPGVKGFKPAIRDHDDDGSPDATDPDPNDPNVK